jgi:hypothetical protein
MKKKNNGLPEDNLVARRCPRHASASFHAMHEMAGSHLLGGCTLHITRNSSRTTNTMSNFKRHASVIVNRRSFKTNHDSRPWPWGVQYSLQSEAQFTYICQNMQSNACGYVLQRQTARSRPTSRGRLHLSHGSRYMHVAVSKSVELLRKHTVFPSCTVLSSCGLRTMCTRARFTARGAASCQ